MQNPVVKFQLDFGDQQSVLCRSVGVQCLLTFQLCLMINHSLASIEFCLEANAIAS